MDEVGEISDYVQERAGLTADLILGSNIDEKLGDNISVTLIATGFSSNDIPEMRKNIIEKVWLSRVNLIRIILFISLQWRTRTDKVAITVGIINAVNARPVFIHSKGSRGITSLFSGIGSIPFADQIFNGVG